MFNQLSSLKSTGRTAAITTTTKCRPNRMWHYWPAVQCYRGPIIRLEVAWHHCLAFVGEAACKPTVKCYRQRQTTDDRRQRAKQYWPPYTICMWASNNKMVVAVVLNMNIHRAIQSKDLLLQSATAMCMINEEQVHSRWTACGRCVPDVTWSRTWPAGHCQPRTLRVLPRRHAARPAVPRSPCRPVPTLNSASALWLPCVVA